MKVLSTVLAGVLLAANANAGIIVSFDEPTLAVRAGQTASFSGVLTNNGRDPVYLNGNNFTFSVTGDNYTFTHLFFANVPVSLNGGESTGSIGLLDAQLSNFLSQPPGMYSGTWSLWGGLDGEAKEVVGQAEFTVHMTPEPSAFVLLGVGLVSATYLQAIRRA